MPPFSRFTVWDWIDLAHKLWARYGPCRFTAWDWIDLALIIAGAIVLIVGAVRWRRVWPREPLRGAPIRLNVLSIAWIWLTLLAYTLAILIGTGLAQLYQAGAPQSDELDLQRTILGSNLMQVFVILFALWILRQTFRAGWRGAGLGRRPLLLDLIDASKGFVAAFALTSAVAWGTEVLIHLIRPMYEMHEHTVFEALEGPRTPLLISIVAIGGAFILAPIGEELLFRAILQTGLHRIMPSRAGSLRHRWVAILIASAVFGLMHWPLIQHIPALAVLAIVLGYQYERSGSLLVPIIVHMLFNGKSLLWYWAQAR